MPVSTPLEVPFSTTTVQAVATTEVTRYRCATVHITSQGGSSLCVMQGSNDGTNWVTLASLQASSAGLNTSTGSVGIFAVPLNCRYFRINVTGIVSGTTAGVIEFAEAPPAALAAFVTQLPAAVALADATANPTASQIGADVMVFNGTTWDRARSLSAATLAAQSGLGGLVAAGPGQWSVTHTPATNTQATASKAAGGAGVRHVATSIAATFAAGAAAIAAAAPMLVNLRDGATGAGTILWSEYLNVPAVAAQADRLVLSGLNIPGTAATAMTLEFAAAGGPNSFESVALTGYDAS